MKNWLHVDKYFIDLINIQIKFVFLASDIDLCVCVKLVVIEVDSMLVLLKQIENLIQLKKNVQKTFEFCLSLLTNIHLKHFLFLQLNSLKNYQLFLCVHEDPMEPEQQNRQNSQYLDLYKANFIAVQMLVHILFQPV